MKLATAHDHLAPRPNGIPQAVVPAGLSKSLTLSGILWTTHQSKGFILSVPLTNRRTVAHCGTVKVKIKNGISMY